MASADIMGLAEVLALALGLTSCVTAGAAVALCRKWTTEYRSAAREAAARAALAETALAQTRQKRSVAVGKGNQTRAERRRAKVLETAAAIRHAIDEKKKPPQGDLLLDAAPLERETA